MLLVHQIHQSFIDEDQSVPRGVHQRKCRSRGPNLKINTGCVGALLTTFSRFGTQNFPNTAVIPP
jgi:hypothetical protein